MRFNCIISIILTGCCLCQDKVNAQADSSRNLLVKNLSEYLLKAYVSEELAKKMSDTIQYKLSNGLYDSSLNADEFAFAVTLDLRRISNDRHIDVWPIYDRREYIDKLADFIKRPPKKKIYTHSLRRSKKAASTRKKFFELDDTDMFKYGDIKILPGNIGYMEIKEFNRMYYNDRYNKGRTSLASAMNFLEKAGSLIIDLRNNRGGHLYQSMNFCSWFAPAPKSYFMTNQFFIYHYVSKEREIFYDTTYTSSNIYNRYPSPKKVYILVSRRSFSAAEFAAYKIKRYLPETVIIGEKTPGGGNSHTGIIHEKYFSAVIPYARSFDEKNANYTLEGNGVTPDILVPADSAYIVACRLAQQEAGQRSMSKTVFLKKEKPQQKEPLPANYNDYLGNYGRVAIAEEKGSLYLVYDDMVKIPMKYRDLDLFLVDSYEFVRFIRNEGKVTEIVMKHRTGYSESFRRR